MIVYAKQDAGEARPRPVGEWLKGFRTYSGRGVITSCGSLNTVATVWEVFAYTEMMQRECTIQPHIASSQVKFNGKNM